MADNKQKGDLGESLAAEYLIKKGYSIIGRNYRIRNAEIDIIAEKDGTIAFVEVKYRKNNALGTPAEAVNYAKQKKIISAALRFIAENGDDNDYRFDVCEVTPYGINHIENAFWI
ncbi:MAG: YraN family protein [Lachnospiraceae bacterium]|nr:YraN family protein [Lachnospiraceae bacterium]